MAQRARTRAAPPARVKPVLELYLWNMVEIKGIFEGRFKRRFWIFGFWEVLYCVGSTLYFF